MTAAPAPMVLPTCVNSVKPCTHIQLHSTVPEEEKVCLMDRQSCLCRIDTNDFTFWFCLGVKDNVFELVDWSCVALIMCSLLISAPNSIKETILRVMFIKV